MKFEQLNPGPCLTYLVTNKKEAVIIDPVIDHVSDYLSLLEDRQLTLTHVVDTHTHADHISAGPSLKDATDCAYIMHKSAPPKCVTQRVKDGDVLNLAGEEVVVLETPGHTRDSITLKFKDKLLTGDFLFLEDAGAGRDDLPGGDAKSHYESLQKLVGLSGTMMVYPAHEYRKRKPSNLDRQREVNPHMQFRTEEDFVNYIEALKLGPADWMKDVLAANYKCARDPNAAWIPTDVPACEIKGTMNPNAGDVEVHFVCNDKMKAAADRGALLLDVREPSELKGELGQIEGVMNIPVGQISHSMEKLEAYKDKEIVIICRSGGRATTAAQILTTGNFEKVFVLEGGMLGYRRG